MESLALTFVGTALVNNFVLVRFLGLCPLMGVSRDLDHAYGMALATGFVLTLSSVLAWMIHHWILVPLDLPHLRTLGFILVIASVVQFTEHAMRARHPLLYRTLGLYLPLITTNCAVLGVALLNVQAERDLLHALLAGLGAAAGFGLVLLLFAAMRERLQAAPVPAPLRGTPIALVTAGMMALAFMGFAGMGR
ncbi:MAG: electron transport complex subunit RsxA [Lysobacteraceae bacterium]|nr:MAG: electron transport complex subunit RsxA [Xanthomonadaceae bacterium]